MKVFLSWSGLESRACASALRKWLPVMIQRVEPWMSDEDIHAGDRWANNVGDKLEHSHFGIVCVTPLNLNAPWIHFEAGALAKVTSRSRVIPYLLGLETSDVSGPLTQFQQVLGDQEGTLRLIQSINDALEEKNRLSTETVKEVFETFWPKLNDQLDTARTMLSTGPAKPEKRGTEDKLDELLELARAQERRASLLERTVAVGRLVARLSASAGKLPRSNVLQDDVFASWDTLANHDNRFLRILSGRLNDAEAAETIASIGASADNLPDNTGDS